MSYDPASSFPRENFYMCTKRHGQGYPLIEWIIVAHLYNGTHTCKMTELQLCLLACMILKKNTEQRTRKKAYSMIPFIYKIQVTGKTKKHCLRINTSCSQTVKTSKGMINLLFRTAFTSRQRG